jgi:uncharacterized delta-60 repeat protein
MRISYFIFIVLLAFNFQSVYSQYDGLADNSFTSGTGFNNDVVAIALQSDGKILIGGSFTSYNGVNANRIVRLNTNGTLDSSFNFGSGFNGSVSDILVLSDGKIIVVGYFSTYKGSTRNRILKLNSDGSIDNTFSSVGSGTALGIRSIGIQTDNKILISRIFTTSSGVVINNDIVRLNTNGSIDNTFDTGSGFTNGSVETFKITSDGKIYVAGDFLTYKGVTLTMQRIIRLNSDGSKDTTFAFGTGYSGDVLDIALQTDGKIIAGGDFFSYNNSNLTYKINRIDSNGNDDQFGVNGFPFNNSTTNNFVSSLAIQNNGKVIVGGLFTQYNNISNINIVRLNNDGTGTRDNTFVTGIGFNSRVKKIIIQPDGKILVGGYFTGFNGSTHNRIIRLNGSNTLSNEGFEKNEITIYPNPAKETIYISNISKTDFEIYDSLGKLVLKGTSNENQINVNSLKKGIYILKLIDEKNTINQKFIKE